jgi:SAM-dependent methyltransferase
VRADEVVARLRAAGQHRAARIVERMPAQDGVLDDAALDALVVRVHCELQRLHEELQQARRARALLTPLLAPLLASSPKPVRLVDVGCGLGFTLRWLSAYAGWGARVELVGADLDVTLVEEARRLAAVEGLAVRFVAGDAFAPESAVADPARTVVTSTGLVHHVPPDRLASFFATQESLGVAGFAHWDPLPGAVTTLGAWVFHRARMREPVSRHDGVLSVRRAHPAAVLRDAARAGAPSYDVRTTGRRASLSSVMHAVVGSR